jgi:hypothetical protein
MLLRLLYGQSFLSQYLNIDNFCCDELSAKLVASAASALIHSLLLNFNNVSVFFMNLIYFFRFMSGKILEKLMPSQKVLYS